MSRASKRKVQFLYFKAGGGHLSSATAAMQETAKQHPDWDIELVNLQELLRSRDPVSRLTKNKYTSESFYNGMLKRGWTFGSLAMLRALQAGIRKQAPKMEALLEEHWRTTCPDMVVSFVPNFNGVMYRSLKKACPDVPYVTVMTDIADCPPHFWQEKQHQYIVCGSDKAVEQARAVGHTDDHIFQTTGMILKPSFYLSENIDKRVERIKLGLDPDLPTAIIMFGGNGSKVSLDIVKQLEQLPFKMQSIVLCGDNKRLYAKLRGHSRCIRVGYTANVPSFMRVADVFIGKPGPGSISEAVQCGLALIVERNMSTMPQERYNTVWIKNFELGIVVRDLQNVSKALRQMYTRNKINLFQSNAQKINNQAVFEIPIILRHIMLISGSQRPAISSHPIQVTELEADFTTLQSTFIK